MASKNNKLRKIRMIFLREDKERILRELTLRGCVEIIEDDDHFKHPEFAGFLKRETCDAARYEAELAEVEKSFDIIKRFAPKKTTKSVLRLDTTADALLDGEFYSDTLSYARAIIKYEQDYHKLNNEIPIVKENMDKISPWKALELPLDFKGTEQTSAIIGSLSVYSNLPAFKKSLEESVGEVEIISVSTAKKRHNMCIICIKSKLAEVLSILEKFEFVEEQFDNPQGTAADTVERAENRLIEIEAEKADIRDDIIMAANKYDKLLLCYDHLGTKIIREQAAAKMYCTERTLMLTGWVSASLGDAVIGGISKYSCAWELIDPTAEQQPFVNSKTKSSVIKSIFAKEDSQRVDSLKPLEIKTKYAVVGFSASSDEI